MHRRILTLLLFTLFLAFGAQAQTAQTPQTDTTTDEINLDTQLYLIVGTNQDVGDAKMPASLEPVIKQLRATMPFKNYRLAATLLNRVKNEARLDVGWIGAPLSSVPVPTQPPMTKSSFSVRQVKLGRNSEGHSTVQMSGFKFNAQLPVQINASLADNRPLTPVFNYEGANLSTDISMREGEPVVVGTLNVGPSGDAIILVVSAKRTAK